MSYFISALCKKIKLTSMGNSLKSSESSTGADIFIPAIKTNVKIPQYDWKADTISQSLQNCRPDPITTKAKQTVGSIIQNWVLSRCSIRQLQRQLEENKMVTYVINKAICLVLSSAHVCQAAVLANDWAKTAFGPPVGWVFCQIFAFEKKAVGSLLYYCTIYHQW